MGTPITWWLFWGALSLIVYTYLGFPLLAIVLGLLRPRPVKRGSDAPMVSVIVAAYNEAAIITQKLDNTLALDYPRTRLEVIVASDGSEDATNDLVTQHGAPEVRLLALPRQGKNGALNAAVAAARGDILVFTDADATLMPDALRHLVAPFADPLVGGVGGEHEYFGSAGRGVYGHIKQKIKQLQNSATGMTAAEGQIYAIRRALFNSVPNGVTDDFYISLQVPAARRRLVFEPRAVARPIPGPKRQAEFPRKVRVMTRWLYTLWRVRHLLNPLEYGFYALQLFSHKVLHRLVVVPLFVLAVTALMLWGYGWPYKLAVLAQLGLHSAAVLGLLLRGTRLGRLEVFRLPFIFDRGNVAALVAVANLLRGRRYAIWKSQPWHRGLWARLFRMLHCRFGYNLQAIPIEPRDVTRTSWDGFDRESARREVVVLSREGEASGHERRRLSRIDRKDAQQ
jgi:cellulose synthase/poly-beta-1,6-N-acetylglucosamine synthase-like glycosyltransferase